MQRISICDKMKNENLTHEKVVKVLNIFYTDHSIISSIIFDLIRL